MCIFVCPTPRVFLFRSFFWVGGWLSSTYQSKRSGGHIFKRKLTHYWNPEPRTRVLVFVVLRQGWRFIRAWQSSLSLVLGGLGIANPLDLKPMGKVMLSSVFLNHRHGVDPMKGLSMLFAGINHGERTTITPLIKSTANKREAT